jgi:deoxycytidylate deaminase
MFCWCGVPCVDCTGAIINAGITNVFCLKEDCPDYSPQSRWLFTKAGVRLNLINKDDIL